MRNTTRSVIKSLVVGLIILFGIGLSAQVAQADPTLTASPSPVDAGEQVAVTFGFINPDEATTIKFDGQVVASGMSDSMGQYDATFEVPDATAEGMYSVEANGADGHFGSTTIDVTVPPPPPPPEPEPEPEPQPIPPSTATPVDVEAAPATDVDEVVSASEATDAGTPWLAIATALVILAALVCAVLALYLSRRSKKADGDPVDTMVPISYERPVRIQPDVPVAHDAPTLVVGD